MSKGNLSIDPLLDIGEVAIIMKKALRTIRENCADGRFSGTSKDSLGSWLIPLSSLSPLAQARYWAMNLKNAPGGWKEEDMRQLPEEEVRALWLFFEESSEKLKQSAYRDAEACQAWQIIKAQGVHFQIALEQMAQEFGLKQSTISEKISRIKVRYVVKNGVHSFKRRVDLHSTAAKIALAIDSPIFAAYAVGYKRSRYIR